MSESTSLTPREQDALTAWDAGARTYKAVAEQLGVTEGRAGVYVRTAMAKSGRESELPRGGNGRSSSPAAPASPADALKAAADDLRARIEREEARIEQARQDAEQFDADAWRQAEQTRLTDAVKAAQQALKAFKSDEGGVATEATERRQKALSERVTQVEQQVGERTEQLRESLKQYDAALAALA